MDMCVCVCVRACVSCVCARVRDCVRASARRRTKPHPRHHHLHLALQLQARLDDFERVCEDARRSRRASPGRNVRQELPLPRGSSFRHGGFWMDRDVEGGKHTSKILFVEARHTRTMALGHVPPFVAVSTPAAGGQRGLRVVAAAAVALALLAAVVAVQHGSVGRAALMEGSDESMKGWEDGMFPPHATFPAGYHFGDDNGNDLCPAEPLHSRASLTRPRLPFFPRAH